MTEHPKISVVCPTYNSGGFVLKTLKSVLYQTVLPFELIVSDDGSTDDTVQKVNALFQGCNGLDTDIVENPHRGPGATRNAGILRAKGDWIAFIDSDDLWIEKKIALVSEAICNNPEANFVFHNENRIKLDGTKSILHDFDVFYRDEFPLTLQVWRYCIFHTSAITCRKNFLERVGLFDETLMSSQDWELWIRMAPDIHYHFIREVLGIYVERPDNITSTKSFKGLLDRLKVTSMHRKACGASYQLFLFCAMRRIVGYGFEEIRKKFSSNLRQD